jgi:hypothetical protein
MKRYPFFILSLLLLTAVARAQSLGLGGSVDHLSNGIILSYERPLNKRWDLDAGLRVQVNTFSINENKQHYTYYQNGYAMHFPEYFGANLRISRKLIAWRFLRLDLMSNLLLTRHSLLKRSTDLPTRDTNGHWSLQSDVFYTPAALAAELTIGLRLKLRLSPKIALQAASGVGAIWINYKHESFSMKDGRKFIGILMDGPFMNKDRGDFEMVGLDGLPMLYFGLLYTL